VVDPVSDASSPVLRDGTVVAAWLFKANPEVWDIFGHIRRGAPLDAWRMTPSYRVALVRPGHRAVLWITGQRGSGHVPGVWAIGEVTGDPYEDVGDPDDPLWIDLAARGRVRPYVEIDLRPLAAPVARLDLAADPRFVGAEILRSPRMGSPLALTGSELTAILDRAG